MIQIRPVSDLRNKYPEVERLVTQQQQPVFLTKNGYGSMPMLCKKNEKNCINATRRAPNRARHFFCLYAALVCGVCFALPAFADGDPLTVVNNLSTFIFSLIRAIGLILLGWGIVQVGLSLQSHDPSQRSQGFLTLAGGLVITFAKEILDLIMGTGA